MTSSRPNVTPTAPDANTTPLRVISGRVTPQQLLDIDVAAALEGEKRGPWIARIAVERARRILAQHLRRPAA